MTSTFRQFFGRLFFWLGVLATLLGVWQGVDFAQDLIAKRSQAKIMAMPLLRSSKIMRFEATDTVQDAHLVADRIEFAGGVHSALPGSIWLASTVALDKGAVIRTSNIVIIAKSVHGGSIDASGASASGVGQTPVAGGNITLVAGQIANIELLARGDLGASGGTGTSGMDGRAGTCGGFGGYRGAERGGDGGNGQNGGPGADGGHIRVATASIKPPPVPSPYAGGHGGLGGAPGRGGHGGTGCTGLAGSQPTQPDGNPGAKAGDEGIAGSAGSYDYVPLEYQTLLSVVGNSTDPTLVLQAVERSVLAK